MQRLMENLRVFISLNSIRNCMGLITLSIEFYQVYGLAWGTAKMNDQYSPETIDASGSGDGWDAGDPGTLKSRIQELARFWGVVGAVGGWAVLYSLPACIMTTSVGNQQLAFNLMEKYRKYLWCVLDASSAHLISVHSAFRFQTFSFLELASDGRFGSFAGSCPGPAS